MLLSALEQSYLVSRLSLDSFVRLAYACRSCFRAKPYCTSARFKRVLYSTAVKIPQYRTMAPKPPQEKKKIDYTIPRPSSSVILVSPQNEVLLLHRVKTSSSFASAHVFPGGNISSQDGNFPPAGHPDSHNEGIHYRRAAIRELFEESGILLAKNKSTGKVVHVGAAEREKGRHAIHKNELTFDQWLKSRDPEAEPDTDPLVPFSHWITPKTNPRRFTTQMYLYFLPLAQEANNDIVKEIPTEQDSEVQIPTSDGGVEVTEAQFLPATEWLRLAKAGDVLMFPPQVILLSFVAQFLDKPGSNGENPQSISSEESARRRSELYRFIHSGTPPWTHKFISPRPMGVHSDGRGILVLDSAGPELQGTGKKGEPDRVVLVRWTKAGPTEVEVRWRHEVEPQDQTGKSAL